MSVPSLTPGSPRPSAPFRKSGPPIMSVALSTIDTATSQAKLISVCGEVDMSNAHLLVELVEAAVDRRPASILLDLSQVTSFGAHAMDALLQAQQTAAKAGAVLTLRDPAPCVRYLLAGNGVEQLTLIETGRPAPAQPRSRSRSSTA